MFMGGENFPAFSGKAAETEHILFVLNEYWSDNRDGNDHDEHIMRAFECLCSFYSICKDGSMVLGLETSVKLTNIYEKFLQHNNWLFKYWSAKNCTVFHNTTKFHMMIHIAELSRWFNPTWMWCFEWEDFIGKLVASARASTAGTPPYLVPIKVMQCFMMNLHLRLQVLFDRV